MPDFFRKKSSLFANALIAVFFGLILFVPSTVQADLAPDPLACEGNICSGSFDVGGQAVNFEYTQHVAPDGLFKIRFNGGSYASTTELISFIFYDAPQFTGATAYANPNGDYLLPPQEDTTSGKTAYERRLPVGCSDGCDVDFAMSMSYGGLAEGEYTFGLYVFQLGNTGSRSGLKFYVDANAPGNDDESESLEPIGDIELTCADGKDNDLDFYPDCSDSDCLDKQGHPSNPSLICEIPESICHDDFDNDGDGRVDCQDSGCDNMCGDLVSGSCIGYCQYGNEYGSVFCDDSFDNDGDGLVDCRDNLELLPSGEYVTYGFYAEVLTNPSSKICWRHSDYGCPEREDCSSGADDDLDTNYGNEEYDAESLTGKNCFDYDCAGDPACPAKENKLADGSGKDVQCFDGWDNDLDHLIDCNDPDCVGIENPEKSDQLCADREMDMGQQYMFCHDFIGSDVPFDNDGDGTANCEDSDCKQKFGHCGWCPEHEDYRFDACADGLDNDTDNAVDCLDSQCTNRLGKINGAAYCRSTENDSAACSDGFDNDGDGKTDCQDDGCNGITNDLGYTCQFFGETGSQCSDGFDNDGDGLTDCIDDGCWGQASCEDFDWQEASSCIDVPSTSGKVFIAESDPTVTAEADVASRVNETHTITITGSGTYPDMAVFIGTAVNPGLAYPYADGSCTIDNPSFVLTVVEEKALMVYSTAPVTNPTINISCPLPSAPTDTKQYAIALAATKGSGIPEYGERIFSTRVYEDTSPVVKAIEIEGYDFDGNELTVPYGTSVRYRIVPEDPYQPDPSLSSGICQCGLTVDDGTSTGDFSSIDGKCIIDPDPVKRLERRHDKATHLEDDEFILTAYAKDGAGNDSVDFTKLVKVTVTPIVSKQLEITEPGFSTERAPFFSTKRPAYSVMYLQAGFISAKNVTFTGSTSCDVSIVDESGIAVSSGATIFGTEAGINGISCLGTLDLSAVIFSDQNLNTDKHYYVQVSATDNDGNTVITPKQEFFVCNSMPTPDKGGGYNPCHWADFDNDGATEGYYTDLYTRSGGMTDFAYRPCDNCVSLSNPEQADWNLDGVGDACTQDGRCEVDKDYACNYWSWEYTPETGLGSCQETTEDSCCDIDTNPMCCPAPTWAEDEVGEPLRTQQMCMPEWGLCSLTGYVCFDNFDCPISGVCIDDKNKPQDYDKNGEDDICYVDADCDVEEGHTCTEAEECVGLIFPWLESQRGNVYSGLNIRSREIPPENAYNATFCITAKGEVMEAPAGLGPTFRTELCPKESDETDRDKKTDMRLPTAGNSFNTVLGRIDVAGLLAGRYGEVVQLTPDAFKNKFNTSSGSPLEGKIYLISGEDLVIDYELEIVDSGVENKDAAGTVVVLGGNLRIRDNVKYGTHLSNLSSIHQVASIGWIVLDDMGAGGNIFVDGGVTELTGAFYASGQGGFYTVEPPETDSINPLTVSGLVMARQFHLSRTYRSENRGSEQFLYDGRAIFNPPPGFSDLTKSLPIYGISPPLP